MPKYLIAFFMLAFLVGSCVTAPDSHTQPPTAPVKPTITLSPVPSPTPTPMPRTQERLIVKRNDNRLALFNADGSLYKSIQAPGDVDIEPLDQAVSTDGNWLVHISGSIEEPPYNLALHLLNLEDETTRLVANVLSPDFPENIEPILKTIQPEDEHLYGSDCYQDAQCLRQSVETEMLITAGDYEWSPDGRFLAFAAQIDGPSLELYIYSMQDGTIQRLTDDLQNIDALEWSPDGKRLFYANSIPGTGILFYGRIFHVIDLEGRDFELPHRSLTENGRWVLYGWISNDLYLFQTMYDEEPQRRQLTIFNAENQKLKEIWPYSVGGLAIDRQNQRIVLSFDSDIYPNAPQPGTYFVSTKGDYKKISDQVFSEIIGIPEIIGLDSSGEAAYHILSDGSIKRIGPADPTWANSSSPNKRWFFIEHQEDESRYRLTLYNDAYQAINSWMFRENLMGTSWRPDSAGIFLFTLESVYYLDIPSGKPRLLDAEGDCIPMGCRAPSFTWLP